MINFICYHTKRISKMQLLGWMLSLKNSRMKKRMIGHPLQDINKLYKEFTGKVVPMLKKLIAYQ